MAIVSSATAQTLSIASVEAKEGEQAELVVNASDISGMTALQFNLALPQGITLDESAITKGEAASDHTLSVQTMDNGDRLVVLYNMDLGLFTNGTLLRLPVTIGNDAKTGEGKLYTVRTATTEAVSQTCTDATFTVTVKEATGIGEVRKDGTARNAYDLSGRRVLRPSKGIQIIGNKKVVKR